MIRQTGNLLDLAVAGHFDVVVQGCNCFCTMGSGIAREIKDRFPEAYTVDCETTSGDREKLGSFTSAVTKHGFTIVNGYTQYGFNRADTLDDLFEYDAFEILLANLVEEYGSKRFGFPYIGMGLAGGDRTRIIAYLEDFAQKVEDRGGSVTLVQFQP